jgi:hypothetical protein
MACQWNRGQLLRNSIVQPKAAAVFSRFVQHYSLQAIITVGFKIENERAVQMGWPLGKLRPKGKSNATVFPSPRTTPGSSNWGKCSAYLDMAEMQAMRRIPMTMEDWESSK